MLLLFVCLFICPSFPLRSRHANAIENPVYSAVDKQESVSGPKASTLPLSSKQQNGVIKGPLDPTVPYATIHKKKKAKKPRHEPHEPASGEDVIEFIRYIKKCV